MKITTSILALNIIIFGIVTFKAKAETTIIHANGEMVNIEKMSCDAYGSFVYEKDDKLVKLSSGDLCVGDLCLTDSFDSDKECMEGKKSVSSKKHYGIGRDEIIIYGSNTVGAALMPALIIENAKKNNLIAQKLTTKAGLDTYFNIKDKLGSDVFGVDIKARGSGTAFPALASRSAEIGMASRPIKASELRKMNIAGFENMRSSGQEHVLALDGLVVIVAPSNPVKTLRISQIASIFAGDITNWKQVGGKDLAINVYARDKHSGTFDTFKGLVLKPHNKSITKSAKRFESNQALSNSVGKDAGGIGFTGFAFIENVKPLNLATECGIVSTPTEFAVKTEEYPLSRRLYLYTRPEKLTPFAQTLLDFSLSDDAQPIVKQVGFINQDISMSSYADQPSLSATLTTSGGATRTSKELAKLLKGKTRLSTTVRFENFSETREALLDYDIKTHADLKRVAKMLVQSEFSEVYLIGHSNNADPSTLAQEMVDMVHDEIYDLLPVSESVKFITKTYKAIAPVACNSSMNGQTKNRRVEIWVK